MNEFSSKLSKSLCDNFIGLYLSGSIALNGYHENKSDIDFVVVIKEPLTAESENNILYIHKAIKMRFTKPIIEGIYVPVSELGRPEKKAFTYHDGIASYSFAVGNAVTWFTLKKYGITVDGVPITEIHFDFDDETLISYVRNNVNTYWKRWLGHSSRLFSKKGLYALTAGSVEWGVLGISRMYYTLKEFDVVSKEAAGTYALRHVPQKYERILKEAIHIRNNEKSRLFLTSFRRRRDMIGYMRYLIDECNAIALNGPNGIPNKN